MIGAWITGTLLGVLDGTIEAVWTDRRIAAKDRRKLPHPLLWLVRIAVCCALAYAEGRVMCYDCASHVFLRDAAVMFIVLASIHRPQYNLMRDSRMIRWWYMGVRLPYRRFGDSWYDSLFHVLARITGENYNARLPFLLAMATELTAALLITLNH